MKNFYLLILCIIFFNSYVNSQSLDWGLSFGGSANELGRDIVVDANDNVYITGQFSGTVDFDSGIGVDNKTSNGMLDIFVLKLNASGGFEWVRTFGGTGNDVGRGITVEDSGNVVVVGTYENTVDFATNGTPINETSNGGKDMFILELSSSGSTLFNHSIGGSGEDVMFDVKVDFNNDYIFTGSFMGTVDFNSGPGTSNITSGGFGDAFVLKMTYNSRAGEHTFSWAKNFDSTSSAYSNAGRTLVIEASNNIIVAGEGLGTTDFDPGAGTAFDTFNSVDMFLVKLNPSGDYIMHKTFKSTTSPQGLDYIRDIHLDSNNNIIISGEYSRTVDFDPGPGVFALSTDNINADSPYPFLLKLNNSGDFIWVEDFRNIGTIARGYSCAVDANDGIYITGQFDSYFDTNPGPAVNDIQAVGISDAYIVKLNASGGFEMRRQFGGNTGDSTTNMIIKGNAIYQLGRFQGTADIDPQGGTTFNVSSNGGYDIFVHKLINNTLDVKSFSKNDFQMYPNPVSESITFRSKSDFSYSIFSMDGKLIFKDFGYSDLVKLDISGLTSGIYLLELDFKNLEEKFTKKIIKK